MSHAVRPESAADRAAVHAVHRAAFADEGPVICDLVVALAGSGRRAAGLVAESGGRVVGHVLLSRCWVDAEQELVDVLVLGPLGVTPEAQGAGVGTALVAAALATAQALESPAVFLEGDPRYYGRRGFEAASRHGFVRPSPRIPEAAFQVALLAAYESWMTGPLVYCDPFWALDCVGLRGDRLHQARAELGD